MAPSEGAQVIGVYVKFYRNLPPINNNHSQKMGKLKKLKFLDMLKENVV